MIKEICTTCSFWFNENNLDKGKCYNSKFLDDIKLEIPVSDLDFTISTGQNFGCIHWSVNEKVFEDNN